MASTALRDGKMSIFPLSILIWEADKLQFNKLKLYKHLHTKKINRSQKTSLWMFVIYVRAALLPECYPDLGFMLTIASVYAISDEDFW